MISLCLLRELQASIFLRFQSITLMRFGLYCVYDSLREFETAGETPELIQFGGLYWSQADAGQLARLNELFDVPVRGAVLALIQKRINDWNER